MFKLVRLEQTSLVDNRFGMADAIKAVDQCKASKWSKDVQVPNAHSKHRTQSPQQHSNAEEE